MLRFLGQPKIGNDGEVADFVRAVVGGIIHLFNSAVLGLVFVTIVTPTSLRRYADSESATIGLGAAYGVVLWIITGSILLPLWLQAAGVAGAPPVPTFALPGLVWHLAYGIVLGAVYRYVIAH